MNARRLFLSLFLTTFFSSASIAQTVSECLTPVTINLGTTTIDDEFDIAEVTVAARLLSNAENISLEITSPSGTSVTVWDGDEDRPMGFGIDCVFSDEGLGECLGSGALSARVSDDETVSITHCYGCLIRAADCRTNGIRGLSELDGQNSKGEWTYWAWRTSGGSLEGLELCLNLYDVAPPDSFSCSTNDSGNLEIEFLSNGSQDAFRLYRDGELITTIDDGPYDDGELVEVEIEDLEIPAPSLQLFQLVSWTDAIEGPPTQCAFSVQGDADFSIEDEPDVTIDSDDSGTFLLEFEDSVEIADITATLEISDITLAVECEVLLVSPAGTSVGLFAGEIPPETTELRFSELGLRPEFRHGHCDCDLRPHGIGRLTDFVGEETIDSVTDDATWLLDVAVGPQSSLDVDRIEIQIFEDQHAFRVSDLTCELDSGAIVASWENQADYESLEILIDGEVVEVIDDDTELERNETVDYTTERLAAGWHFFGVRGIVDGAGSPVVECAINVSVPPVWDVLCENPDDEGGISVIWSLPMVYDSIRIEINDDSEVLDGAEAIYTISEPSVGAVNVRVIGILDDVGESRAETCATLVWEPGDTQVCGDPQVSVGSLTTEAATVFDVLTLEEVRVFIDYVGILYQTDFAVESPLGTTISLHQAGNFDRDLLAIFSEEGTATGDPHKCACEREPQGDLEDLVGEVSDGEWSLVLQTVYGGTLQQWCVILDGCAEPSPDALECETNNSDVDLTWDLPTTYDAILVFRGREQIAELEGDATEYQDEAVAAGRWEYRVSGVLDDLECEAQSLPCWHDHGLVEECGDSFTVAGVSTIVEDIEIEDELHADAVQLAIELGSSQLWRVELQLEFDDTDVVLHDNEGSTARLDVVYSDAGEIFNHEDSECGCPTLPTGPGWLRDLVRESVVGTWSLTTINSSGYTVSVDAWCLAFESLCDVQAPSVAGCEVDESTPSVTLTWENASDGYDGIEVVRNGVLIAEIDASETEFVDLEPVPGRIEYQVVAVDDKLECSKYSQPCWATIGGLEACSEEILEDGPSDVFSLQSIEWDPEIATDCLDADGRRVAELGVELLFESDDLEDYTIQLQSPSGTDLLLLDGELTYFNRDLDVTFMDSGTPWRPRDVNCDCVIRTTSVGTLADYVDEDPRGDWSLIALSWPPGATGTLESWCVHVYPRTFVSPQFLRGDIDGSGTVVALLDALALLEWAFLDGVEPPCADAADVDDSGTVQSLIDSFALLSWAFLSAEVPADPGPSECGHDPTEDELTCETPSDVCSAPCDTD